MVTVFLANGFEEMEAMVPVDLLRRSKIQVQTAAVGTNPMMHGGKVVTGAHGISVLCDVVAEQVTADEMEMLVLPGGGEGTQNLENSPIVAQWLSYAEKHDIFVGAICAAPSILGKMGMLDGKKATAYPGFEPKNAVCTGDFVVRDGKYITAKGPAACLEFAFELLSCLKGEQAVQSVKGEIQCQK